MFLRLCGKERFMLRLKLKATFFVFVLTVTNILGFASFLEAEPMPYVDKSKVRVVVEPGKQEYGVMIMENPTGEARAMKVYVEDWYYASTGDGAKEFLPAGTASRSCASWITFSPAEFTIPAFGRQRINYSVKVPAGKEGGYFASMFFETGLSSAKPDEDITSTSAGINLSLRVATLFYAEAKGTVDRKVDFKNLILKKQDLKGLVLELDMENSGNTDVVCSGTYHIINKSGKIFARGKFDNVYTLPADKLKMSSLWKDNLPAGLYDLVFTFDLGKGLEDTGAGRGPIVTREYKFEVGADGAIGSITEQGIKDK